MKQAYDVEDFVVHTPLLLSRKLSKYGPPSYFIRCKRKCSGRREENCFTLSLLIGW